MPHRRNRDYVAIGVIVHLAASPAAQRTALHLQRAATRVQSAAGHNRACLVHYLKRLDALEVGVR